MSDLHPQLCDILRELDAATARARHVAEGVDEATFSRRPEASAWSAAECVEHLSLTTRAFLPLIDAALAEPAGAAVANDRRFRRDVAGALLGWVIEPPYRMKVKTLAPFEPLEPSSRALVLDEFEALQDELAERVRAASGRDLGALRLQSPFSGRVRYNLYSTFRIISAHERRHLWQAERTLERLTKG
jgi:hypothetical protein